MHGGGYVRARRFGVNLCRLRTTSFGCAHLKLIFDARSAISICALLIGLAFAGIANAQRAEDNAITQAEDAFGSSNGFQTVGLYTVTDARGFNPQQAGNIRIEGLYADLTTQYLSYCLVRESTIRVGISAQSYDFQAPTGIANLTLSVPGRTSGSSVIASAGELGFSSTLIEAHRPISETLSAQACMSVTTNFMPDTNFHLRSTDGAVIAHFRPSETTEIIPFITLSHGGEHGLVPLVYADGISPVPSFRSRPLGAQRFTSVGWHNLTGGALLRQQLSPHWHMDVGLFRSVETDPQQFNDQYLLGPDVLHPEHVLDVMPAIQWGSTSGEIKVAYSSGTETHHHTVKLMLRGRNSEHGYGGDATIDYGPQDIRSPIVTRALPFSTTATSIDRTRQWDVGTVIEEQWTSHATIAAGLLHSHYQRSLAEPSATVGMEQVTATLPFARIRVELSPRLSLYGSAVQGLEDSALAPTYASNHGQPPPTTRSRQTDLGLQVRMSPRLSATGGLFEIHKPYFNVDSADRYRNLGNLRQRGAEFSARYANDELTLLVGSVLLQPRLDSAYESASQSSRVPVGPAPLTHLVNLDWAPPTLKPWALSAQITHLARRTVTETNAFFLSPLTIANVGVRYERAWDGHPFSARLDVSNAGDTHGARINSQYLVTPEPGRRLQLTVAMDF